ncbi:cytochrome-c peroxidase [Pedobacter polaris]|nr:cytochrome c peroxidase [Pedobacter polaris]
MPKIEEIVFKVPANFPDAVYKFEDNTLSKNGFELGKKLFYDTRLSADKSVSCGSCHQQFAAFAQLDHAVSHGVDNCLGKRNAPVLFNLAWQKEFFWDGGAKNLEIVPINAVTDACEMRTDLTKVVSFLNNTSPYPQLFKDAFGNSTVNSQNFLKALTQFTAAMISANSKYDKVIRKETSFTIEEQNGYHLFNEKCASCHAGSLFTDLSYKSNGLDLTSIDEGRKTITGLASDLGKFRVPTLRNIELSSPYMHDGRFNSLEKVLEHYNTGVKHATNLDATLFQNGKLGISLSSAQKQQLISFLKTLTDNEFIKNKNFSEN